MKIEGIVLENLLSDFAGTAVCSTDIINVICFLVAFLRSNSEAG